MSEQDTQHPSDAGAEHHADIPLTDLMRIRRDKLHKLAAMGVNPYPYKYDRTHQIADLLSSFDALAQQSATVRVCSSTAGTPTGSGASKISACRTFGGGSFTGSPAPDPEAPLFLLSRVDVQYTVSPIIPAFQLPTPAGPISLTIIPNLNFRRHISMREMN